MAQKPSKPPQRPVKVTVIRGKPAEAEMREMRRVAKAQAPSKNKR
jgi:hypothetical protein